MAKLALLLLVACVQGPAPVPTPAPVPAPAQRTPVPAQPTPAPQAHRDQPAATKLRLGHYRNKARGIGVTIDLTERNASVALPDPAKLRFDGETEVMRLEGKFGPDGRIDYVRGKLVVLHAWPDGRMAVYVTDPDRPTSDDAIDLDRDADADPL